ncbi:hypothetical protein [Stratiformator vulcanicus]|uniref:Zinc carboxypeptidase n=1 Tax=Stratiformator vulcanicus TaxID=2527980 RepID=A0A517R765_9PLAN|nr:hypothetical protein [Stratiformator vulcanicus]QDT39692.1 hypothetical protein Pan189_41010 [Stratiformator vulcanicus]
MLAVRNLISALALLILLGGSSFGSADEQTPSKRPIVIRIDRGDETIVIKVPEGGQITTKSAAGNATRTPAESDTQSELTQPATNWVVINNPNIAGRMTFVERDRIDLRALQADGTYRILAKGIPVQDVSKDKSGKVKRIILGDRDRILPLIQIIPKKWLEVVTSGQGNPSEEQSTYEALSDPAGRLRSALRYWDRNSEDLASRSAKDESTERTLWMLLDRETVQITPNYILNPKPLMTDEWAGALEALNKIDNPNLNAKVLRAFLESPQPNETISFGANNGIAMFFPPKVAAAAGQTTSAGGGRYDDLPNGGWTGISSLHSVRPMLRIASPYHLPFHENVDVPKKSVSAFGEIMLRRPAPQDRSTLKVSLYNTDGYPIRGWKFLYGPVTFGGQFGESREMGSNGIVTIEGLAPQRFLIGFDQRMEQKWRHEVILKPGHETHVKFNLDWYQVLKEPRVVHKSFDEIKAEAARRAKYAKLTSIVKESGVRTIEGPDGVKLSDGMPFSPKYGTLGVVGPNHFQVKYEGENREESGWFLFGIENAKGKQITLDLVGGRQDKWLTLNPSIIDASDLTDPSAYAVANSDSQPGTTKAINGPLLPDTSGERWRFVKRSEYLPAEDTLRFTFTPESDQSHLAMRPTFTMGFYQQWLAELRMDSTVTVHDVGTSDDGFPLVIVELGRQDDPHRETDRCLVLNCGEMGDQPDTNWAAYGVVEKYRQAVKEGNAPWPKDTTVLVVPMMDPDTAYQGNWLGSYVSFDCCGSRKGTTATKAFAKFFTNWVNDGFRLDLVLTLYNPESAEAANVRMIGIPSGSRYKSALASLHSSILNTFKDRSYNVDKKQYPRRGRPSCRMSGYCGDRFGTMYLAYFVNSRGPKRHLTLKQTRATGPLIVRGAIDFLHSKEARQALKQVDEKRDERARKWQFYDKPLNVADGKRAIELEWDIYRADDPRKVSKDK